MHFHRPLLEKDQVVVGKPLPFSIFTAEGKLLLAVGSIVPSERARQILLTNGTHRSTYPNNQHHTAAPDMDERPVLGPLPLLQKTYRARGSHRRFVLTLARDGTAEALRANVIGVHEN